EAVDDAGDVRVVAGKRLGELAHRQRVLGIERLERPELGGREVELRGDGQKARALRGEKLGDERPSLAGGRSLECLHATYGTCPRTWLPTSTFLLACRGMEGIVIDGLVRVFKGGIRAVDGIDLEVAPGEIYGFLGPNGAGKSTTVRMLPTLLPPREGTARVAGHDVVNDGAAVRRAIGAALQEAALDPYLTGREHMRLQAGLHGFDRTERDRRAEELLDRVGLSDAADRKVGGYSGGMKRRLDLGLALVHRPRILFLDEPTTGLDPQSRTALWEEVERLSADEGVTVFLTTQYLEEADVLADRVG